MDKVVTARDYTTLNVSRLDDGVALFALHPTVLERIMKRNIDIMKESISLIDDLVQQNSERCSWTKAVGGGTAFVKILNREGKPVDDVAFCAQLVEDEGISIIPGNHCFSEPGAKGFQGYVRINLGEPQRLRGCLKTIESFIRRY
jgi:aspartate/methionine/tyrosine aminotransferase